MKQKKSQRVTSTPIEEPNQAESGQLLDDTLISL